MFQYQAYPSGNTNIYKIMVNSISGVSAILDRRMGIVEHSLSGVAYYITNISNYINNNNVGTSGTPITSGYFTNVGFNNFVPSNQNSYQTTLDGIISGVNNISVSGVISNSIRPTVKILTATSGYFYNSVFDHCFIGLTNVTNFTVSGIIKNTYSGLITNDTHSILNSTIPTIGDSTTYPFLISSSSGILNNISIRSFINSTVNEFGILDDIISSNIFTVNNLLGINVSGNIYVSNLYKVNLTNYNSSSDWFGESLFELKNHNHTGTDSSALSFDKFNSSQPITDPFTMMISGNINVQNNYIGNDIGLESSWEIFSCKDGDIIQKLVSYKGRLFILDNKKLIDVENNTIKLSIQDYPRAQVIATPNGDKLALINNLINNNAILPSGTITHVNFLLFDSSYNMALPFPTTGATTPFTNLTSRVAIGADDGVRINKNLYLSYIETYSGTAATVLTIYAIDTISMTLSIAAQSELTGTDWGFYPPIKTKEAIYYFFNTNDGSYTGNVLVFNIYIKPSKSIKFEVPTYPVSTFYYQQMENMTNQRYNCSIFSSSVSDRVNGVDLLKGFFGPTIGQRTLSSVTMFHNRIIFTSDVVGYNNYTSLFLTPLDRNTFSLSTYNAVRSTNIISYAGKLWMGPFLSNTVTIDSLISWKPHLYRSLVNLANNPLVWVVKPIIINGWIYAIAETASYTNWVSSDASLHYLINYYLPQGGFIIRRRASETELIDMTAYTL